MNKNAKRLYRSDDNKVILGVMGGLGEYFDIDPTILRVVYIIFAFFTALVPGILAYIFMGLVMPKKVTVVHEKSEDIKH